MKSRDQCRYGEFQKIVKLKIRTAKEEWMGERCREIEQLNDKHDHFNTYKKMKEMTLRKHNSIYSKLTNPNRCLVKDTKEELKMWKSCVEQMRDRATLNVCVD